MSKIEVRAPAADPIVAIEAVGTAGAGGAGGPGSRRRSSLMAVGSYAVTVFVLITLNFALPRMMPGDPIDALMAFGSPNYVTDAETRADLEDYYNLDGSPAEQYVHYLARLAHGNLGVSIVSNVPVAKELGGRLAWSFLLMVTALAISLLIGIPAGVHSGWHRGKKVDRGFLALFVSLQNVPVYLLGAVVFVVFSAKLGLFPSTGAESAFDQYSGFGRVLDIARHLTLPALLLAFDFATYQYLVMRSSMVSELGSDYLLGGRAKGLADRKLKYGYAGRNALLPVVTVVGLQFGIAITSIVFIEQIFSYPGVGGYMLEAVGTRDYPAMQGAFLLLTLTVVTANLVVDLIYRRLDPRTVA